MHIEDQGKIDDLKDIENYNDRLKNWNWLLEPREFVNWSNSNFKVTEKSFNIYVQLLSDLISHLWTVKEDKK